MDYYLLAAMPSEGRRDPVSTTWRYHVVNLCIFGGALAVDHAVTSAKYSAIIK
jgi:hypothetical protein